MNPPTIEEKGMSYVLTWAEESIEIRMSKLVEHRDRVTSEINVSTLLSPETPHLMQSNLNITSAESRTRIAKKLTTRYKVKIDWDTLIEQLCVITLQRFRQGELAVELWGYDAEVKPPEYLLHPLLVKNYANVIFGDPGSFKSAFAEICVALVTLPLKDNELGLTVRNKPTKCLYLDWETDRETVNWTLMRVTKGMDLPAFALTYRRCTFSLASSVEQIGKIVADIGADMLVIDSLGLASGKDLLKTESPIEFFSALRVLNLTSLILAHNAKDDGRKDRSIYGNQYFTAQARNIWEIRTVKEAGDEELDIALFHKKAPPFGKLQKPIGYHIDFTPNTIAIKKQDATNQREFVAVMGTQSQILDLLKGGSLNIKQIAIELGITENNTGVALHRLKKKDIITKVDDSWGLTYHELH